jgi:hypothetical protein
MVLARLWLRVFTVSFEVKLSVEPFAGRAKPKLANPGFPLFSGFPNSASDASASS